ncbi:hypothetical protein OE88DRAFT_1738493 [Heliocybe sulcata]|uniref:Uncharacterized protein n=1 Tax=Heliocybe sulcata TaxID=5364 RepID=A0A5C3MRL0_9AGAM|nr:hypothetical protein OE88DRAFT_1738493 [Heliocybe sulcata]
MPFIGGPITKFNIPSCRGWPETTSLSKAPLLHLNASVFGALQILKSAYRNGHISASKEAADFVKDLKFHSDVGDDEWTDVDDDGDIV